MIKKIFLRCFVLLWLVFSLLEAGSTKTHALSTENIITLRWGVAQWHSPTQAKIPLTIKIKPGWKIYGPSEETDTIVRPTTLVAEPSLHPFSLHTTWPKPQLLEEKGIKSHVYYDTVTALVDVSLETRQASTLNISVKGLSCSSVCAPFSVKTALNLTPPPFALGQWLKIIGLAFLGGLILNVMPCVLPILGLKLKGLIAVSSRAFRTGCLFTTIGIVIGFWALAITIIMAKDLFKMQVGWGMQLQNPYFTAIMAAIMIAGGYGLLGIFHLNAPSWAVQAATSGTSRSVIKQSLLSGLLGVLLATPCSAPFLGASIGFALTGGPLEVFLFYTAIALGFASPYILGIILPVYKILPKPGSWMIGIERVMGILFLISGAFLVLFPLSAFLPLYLKHISIFFLVMFALIPLCHAFIPLLRKGRAHTIWVYGLPLIMGAALCLFPLVGMRQETLSMKDGGIQWNKFNEQEMEGFLRKGKIVFVDATGIGCALCMVNKRIFHRPAIQKALTHENVICMRADYSHGSPEILGFLKRHNRAAIPFNAVLSQEIPHGIVLSEVLREKEILEAFTVIDRIKSHVQNGDESALVSSQKPE